MMVRLVKSVQSCFARKPKAVQSSFARKPKAKRELVLSTRPKIKKKFLVAMTLIFSNKNRILFNRENADQLLELSYGNRFIPLLDLVLPNVYKQNKVLFTMSSNLFFDVSKKKNKRWNLSSKSLILTSSGHNLFNKHKEERGNKWNPTYFQFFGISLLTKPLTRTHKKAYSNNQNEKVSLNSLSAYKSKALFTSSYEASKRETIISYKTYRDYKAEQSLGPYKTVLNTSASNKAEICTRFYLEGLKSRLGPGSLFSSKTVAPKVDSIDTLNSKQVSTFFITNHYSFLKTLIKQNILVKGLKKVEGIKVLVPKMNLWGFAFGSSFLLIIMASILQRQEQNSWCFPFLKRKIPGVSTCYQETSWGCFENITSKYLNGFTNKREFNLSHQNSQFVSKVCQIKNIDVYKDQLYINFAEPWNLQFNKNFTAVFSNELSWSCKQEQQSFPYKKELFKNAPLRQKAEKNRWIVKPVYQMHAQIPLHHSYNKDRLFTENDTIPSKMACSANTIFGDNSKIRNIWPLFLFEKNKKDEVLGEKEAALYESKKTKRQKKNVEPIQSMERQNDIVKNFFYEYGLFSIPTKAASVSSKESSKEQDFQDIVSSYQHPYARESLVQSLSDVNFGRHIASRLLSTFASTNRRFVRKFARGVDRSIIDASKCQHFEQDKKQKQRTEPYSGNLPLQNSVLYGSGEKSRTFFTSSHGLKGKRQNSYEYKYKSSICKEIFTCKEIFNKKDQSNKYPLYKFNTDTSDKLNRSMAIPIEKVSSYFLSKTSTIGTRLMSGYKLAEAKDFRTLNKNQVYIKIPPTLPFHETAFSSFLHGILCQQIPKPRYFCFPKTSSGPYNQEKKSESKIYVASSKKKAFSNGNKSTESRVLKKLPYRQLSLNEFQEIKPLFEQVNQEIRISPHKLAFQKPLFTDYNDYLSRPKDSPAAISISPSLEEDQAIYQSWNEHVEREALVNQNVEKSKSFKEKYIDDKGFSPSSQFDVPKWQRKEDSNSTSSLPIEDLDRIHFAGKGQKEARTNQNDLENSPLYDSQFIEGESKKESDLLLNPETKLSNGVELDEEKEFNEEEKKKEITKWEWLHNVRESELDTEKRKDFQKFAYPKKEALFTKHLQPITNPYKKVIFRNIKNCLVSDRKSSFFGITNMFPKRLVAEDQRQINDQIMFEDYDQRKANFFKSLKKSKEVPSQTEAVRPIDSQSILNDDTLLQGIASKNLLFAKTYSQERYKNKKQDKNENREIVSVLRIAPRNRELYHLKTVNPGLKKKLYNSSCRINSQHPVYTPSRRLRLRVAEFSKTEQNNNPQSRIDSLNLCQSHRWWQKRRLASNLLGAPSKRFMVMPEIGKEDWRKIIKWQLKTYFLEEEKRLQPLILEKIGLEKSNLFSNFNLAEKNNDQKNIEPVKRSNAVDLQTEDFIPLSENTYTQSNLPLLGTSGASSNQQGKGREQSVVHTLDPFKAKQKDFKIKKIAVYLPWLTIKKSLQKPFEWPLTRLSYQSQDQNFVSSSLLKSGSESRIKSLGGQISDLDGLGMYLLTSTNKPLKHESIKALKQSEALLARSAYFALAKFTKKKNNYFIPFTNSKKPDYCLVSSLSPQFKALSFSSFKPLFERSNLFLYKLPPSKVAAKIKDTIAKTKIYKPFIFEVATKDSHLLLHQLLLAIAIKQIFQKIFDLFGHILIDRVKNSSLGIALLPLFFNASYRENQVSELYHLKKRLKDIVGSEDSISSLSEIVWYLRNSCRGRMVPRGVVLVESHDSESTEFLKAVGGEAQVPVIVQSLRALPLTQNHPQRRLEKILKLAERRAPCILFLDDLDAIGKVRTLLINGNRDNQSSSQSPNLLHNRQNLRLSNEKIKWKRSTTGSPLESNNSYGVGGQSFDFSLASNTKKDQKKISLIDRNPIFRGKQNRHTNMLSFSSNSARKSESQEAHTFLLNHFLSRRGFYNSTTSGAPSNFSNHVNNISANQIAYNSKIGSAGKAFGSKVHSKETDKMIEQRRLDLMLRLLTVMDGISHLKGVLIVTTSKNPSSLDPALLRPGRFERFINLKLPNKKRRIELLKVHTSKIGHTNPMPWEYLGAETENMNGTSIAEAVNHSAFRAIIQSTVHTLSTLEYGLSRVNGQAFTNTKNLECTEALSYKLLDKLANPSLAASLALPYSPSKTQFCKGDNTDEESSTLLSSLPYSLKGVRAGEQSKANKSSYKYKILPSGFDKSNRKNEDFFTSFFTEPKMRAEQLQSEQRKICIISSPYTTLVTENSALPSNRQTLSINQRAKMQKKKLHQFFSIKNTIYGSWFCKPDLSHKNTRFVRALSQLSFYQAGKGVVQSLLFANMQEDPTIDNTQHSNLKVADFAQNIVKLYAGRASESLYLDSIVTLKNEVEDEKREKAFSFFTYHFPFLQSNLSYKEQLQATSSISAILNDFGYDSLYLPIKPTLNFSKPLATHFWSKGMIKRSSSLLSQFSYKKHRTRQILSSSCEPHGFLDLYNAVLPSEQKSSQDYWFEEKTCETLKIFKRPTGNWYRLYLPKIEQNKNNREWRTPDRFSHQYAELLNLSTLVQTVKKSASKNSSQYPFYILPKNISIAPSNCFTSTNHSLCNKAFVSIFPKCLFCFSKTTPHFECTFNAYKSPICTCKEISTCTQSNNRRGMPKKTSVLRSNLLYYDIVLSSFYMSFQNLSENRELLDFLSDHLIRFKFLRSHEIMRISSFYVDHNLI